MLVRVFRESRGWFLWVGLLMLVTLFTMIALGSLEASQALTTPDVDIDKSVNPASIPPGTPETALYTITFTNTSEADVILDTVLDTLPSEDFQFIGMHPSSDWVEAPDTDGLDVTWTGPITVGAGSDLSLVYSVLASQPPASSEPYLNTASALTSEGGSVGPASAGIWVAEKELGVAMDAEPAQLGSSEPVTFTVTFSNSGQLTGTLASITGTLDASLAFLGMLPGSGIEAEPEQVDGSLAWTGPFDVPSQGTLTLLFQVSTPEGDDWTELCGQVVADAEGESLGPVEACVSPVSPMTRLYLPVSRNSFTPASISIVKSVSPEVVSTDPGEEVIYTVEMANPGDADGTILDIIDTLPAGFRFLGMEPSSDVTDDPDGTMDTITWSGPFTMTAHSEMRLVYRVEPTTIEGEYTNSLRVTAQGAYTPGEPAAATLKVSPPILLDEDFDSGIGRWTPFLNYWRLKSGQWYWGQKDGVSGSGALTHHCCNVGDAEDALVMYLGEGSDEWTDYRVETQLMSRGGGTPLGLWVRGQYKDVSTRGQWVTGYYVAVGGGANSSTHFVRLLQLQTLTDCWSNACNNPKNLYAFFNPHDLTEVKLPGALKRNKWYKLAVEVEGDNIRVEFDGKKVIDYVDTKEPFLTGTVGFKTYKAKTASFDNIIVTPLEYVSPTDAEPDLPGTAP